MQCQAHTPCLLHIRDFLRFGLESVGLWAGLIKQSWAVGNYWFIQCCQSDSLQNIFSLTSQKPTGSGLVLVNYGITWQGLGHHWIPKRQAEKENVICRLGGSKLGLWHLQSSRWGLVSHWPSSARPDPGQSCGWCWAQEDEATPLTSLDLLIWHMAATLSAEIQTSDRLVSLLRNI